MGTTYWQPPAEVEELARKVIEDHHPELVGVRIDYVFRSPPQVRGSHVVLGKARKISGLSAFLARSNGAFLVMELAGDLWPEWTERRRRAVIDHELCHMATDDNGAPVLVPHDIEEFVAIVERNGIWRRELEQLLLAGQLAIPYDPGEEDQ